MFKTKIKTCHVEISLLLSEFSIKRTKARIAKLVFLVNITDRATLKEVSKYNAFDLV